MAPASGTLDRDGLRHCVLAHDSQHDKAKLQRIMRKSRDRMAELKSTDGYLASLYEAAAKEGQDLDKLLEKDGGNNGGSLALPTSKELRESKGFEVSGCFSPRGRPYVPLGGSLDSSNLSFMDGILRRCRQARAAKEQAAKEQAAREEAAKEEAAKKEAASEPTADGAGRRAPASRFQPPGVPRQRSTALVRRGRAPAKPEKRVGTGPRLPDPSPPTAPGDSADLVAPDATVAPDADADATGISDRPSRETVRDYSRVLNELTYQVEVNRLKQCNGTRKVDAAFPKKVLATAEQHFLTVKTGAKHNRSCLDVAADDDDGVAPLIRGIDAVAGLSEAQERHAIADANAREEREAALRSPTSPLRNKHRLLRGVTGDEDFLAQCVGSNADGSNPDDEDATSDEDKGEGEDDDGSNVVAHLRAPRTRKATRPSKRSIRRGSITAARQLTARRRVDHVQKLSSKLQDMEIRLGHPVPAEAAEADLLQEHPGHSVQKRSARSPRTRPSHAAEALGGAAASRGAQLRTAAETTWLPTHQLARRLGEHKDSFEQTKHRLNESLKRELVRRHMNRVQVLRDDSSYQRFAAETCRSARARLTMRAVEPGPAVNNCNPAAGAPLRLRPNPLVGDKMETLELQWQLQLLQKRMRQQKALQGAAGSAEGNSYSKPERARLDMWTVARVAETSAVQTQAAPLPPFDAERAAREARAGRFFQTEPGTIYEACLLYTLRTFAPADVQAPLQILLKHVQTTLGKRRVLRVAKLRRFTATLPHGCTHHWQCRAVLEFLATEAAATAAATVKRRRHIASNK